MKKFILGLLGLFLLITPAIASQAVYDCAKAKRNGLACLACNVYQEARGEPIQGKFAVALVTVLRSNSTLFPGKICANVWQNELVHYTVWKKRKKHEFYARVAQYSWTANSASKLKVHEYGQWLESIGVASVIWSVHWFSPFTDLLALAVGITPDTFWYHTKSVHPEWDKTMKATVAIGNHIFYKQVALEDVPVPVLRPKMVIEHLRPMETLLSSLPE